MPITTPMPHAQWIDWAPAVNGVSTVCATTPTPKMIRVKVPRNSDDISPSSPLRLNGFPSLTGPARARPAESDAVTAPPSVALLSTLVRGASWGGRWAGAVRPHDRIHCGSHDRWSTMSTIGSELMNPAAQAVKRWPTLVLTPLGRLLASPDRQLALPADDQPRNLAGWGEAQPDQVERPLEDRHVQVRRRARSGHDQHTLHGVRP